ncbi:hypothetical protein ACFX2H_027193 [Malus domestica]
MQLYMQKQSHNLQSKRWRWVASPSPSHCPPMRFKIPNMHHLLPKTLKPLTSTKSQIRTQTLPLDPLQDLDDALCSDHHQ